MMLVKYPSDRNEGGHHMTDAVPRSSRRVTAMRVLAIVMAVSAIGFGLFTAVFGIVNPAQEPHAFHNVVVASLLIVLSAPPVIAIAMAPDRAIRPLVILAAVAVAGLATMAMSLTLDPFTLPFVFLIGALWALAPNREGAVPPGRPSLVLAVLVLAGAAPLIAYALGQAELQRTDHTSEHAAFFHWVETSFYAVAVLLLGVLAALRPAAYRMAAWMGGVALALIGIGAILLPGFASALPSPWGFAALVGGTIFVAGAEWDSRRTT
jgi:hypothetical protein